MKIELLSSPQSDGKRTVRAWIELASDGELKFSDRCYRADVHSFRHSLAAKLGQIAKDEQGIPRLTGELPSAEETLRYMLTHPQLAGRIRQVS